MAHRLVYHSTFKSNKERRRGPRSRNQIDLGSVSTQPVRGLHLPDSIGECVSLNSRLGSINREGPVDFVGDFVLALL